MFAVIELHAAEVESDLTNNTWNSLCDAASKHEYTFLCFRPYYI